MYKYIYIYLYINIYIYNPDVWSHSRSLKQSKPKGRHGSSFVHGQRARQLTLREFIRGHSSAVRCGSHSHGDETRGEGRHPHHVTETPLVSLQLPPGSLRTPQTGARLKVNPRLTGQLSVEWLDLLAPYAVRMCLSTVWGY